MLILTRRKDEKIIIDENIEVIVLGINGNQIKIGIQAPDEIKIMRQELLGREEKAPEPVKIKIKKKRTIHK